MPRMQSSGSGPIRLLSVIVTLAIALSARSSTIAADAEKPKDIAAGLGLSVAETRFLRGIEKKLVTRLNSKANPADRDTWYVLLFLDRAIAQTYGESSSSRTLATLRLMKPDGAVVQGRGEAALATARFLCGANNAGKGVRPPSTGEPAEASRFGGDKLWDYRAFKTEGDERTFLAMVLPHPPKKR